MKGNNDNSEKVFDNEEEDIFRRIPGAIAVLCGNDNGYCNPHIEKPVRDAKTSYSDMFRELSPVIRIGNSILAEYFPPNIDIEGFEQICNSNTQARKNCESLYEIARRAE